MFGKKIKRGISISPSFLSWVEVSGTGEQPEIAGSGIELLPHGIVTPAFARENITDRALLQEKLEKVIPAGKRSGYISLSIPDAALKLSYLTFDELPKKREEVERLILWRLKKNIPLAPEMAKVDYLICPGSNESIDVIAAVASRKVLREYEDLLIGIGLKPKVVDVFSMNLLNLFTAQLKGNFLFLAVNHHSISISVVEKGFVKIFRNKEIEINEDRIIKEVFATITFYKNNFADSFLDAAYLFFQTDIINGKITERIRDSFDGSVSELKLSSVLSQRDDSAIPENLASAIGGALRLK